jgi:two-component system, OmpR family, sensor kinase
VRGLSRPVSLTSRLVVTAVVLVAVVSLLVVAATALAMRGYLTGRLDDEVRSAALRAASEPSPSAFDVFDEGGPGGPGGPGPDDGPQDVRGQRVSTLTAYFYRDYESGVGDVLEDGPRGRTDRRELDDRALEVLDAVPTDGGIHQVDVPGLGTYRVTARTDGVPSKVVAGLPTDDIDDTVTSLVLVELGLALLGLVVAALAGRAVVRRQLRPLREVAATAHTVAGRPLDSGEIGVTERVPTHLTDHRTEVGQVGSALNTLLAHVETSLDARYASEQRVRQFVADASHELRTPLTTIAGYAELARRQPDDPSAGAVALAKVEEESARMTALVEDLLLLARLDSGRPLERAAVDLTRLLVEAVSDARVLAPEHRWRLDLPDTPVEVTGDALRLHQVATNLLTNARIHTPPGTTVTVVVRPGGFAVHDDGPGFPPDLVPHAFERFARADAGRRRDGGVGLGLALVQAITAAHGGSVALTSRPGDTRVEVRLPAELVDAALSDNLGPARYRGP